MVTKYMEKDATVWSDHQALEKVLATGPFLDRCQHYENADLWQEIRQHLLDNRHLALQVKWVNSHGDRDVQEHGIGYDPLIEDQVYVGNLLADTLAGQAAALYEIPEDVSQQQVHMENAQAH